MPARVSFVAVLITDTVSAPSVFLRFSVSCYKSCYAHRNLAAHVSGAMLTFSKRKFLLLIILA